MYYKPVLRRSHLGRSDDFFASRLLPGWPFAFFVLGFLAVVFPGLPRAALPAIFVSLVIRRARAGVDARVRGILRDNRLLRSHIRPWSIFWSLVASIWHLQGTIVRFLVPTVINTAVIWVTC